MAPPTYLPRSPAATQEDCIRVRDRGCKQSKPVVVTAQRGPATISNYHVTLSKSQPLFVSNPSLPVPHLRVEPFVIAVKACKDNLYRRISARCFSINSDGLAFQEHYACTKPVGTSRDPLCCFTDSLVRSLHRTSSIMFVSGKSTVCPLVTQSTWQKVLGGGVFWKHVRDIPLPQCGSSYQSYGLY